MYGQKPLIFVSNASSPDLRCDHSTAKSIDRMKGATWSMTDIANWIATWKKQILKLLTNWLIQNNEDGTEICYKCFFTVLFRFVKLQTKSMGKPL